MELSHIYEINAVGPILSMGPVNLAFWILLRDALVIFWIYVSRYFETFRNVVITTYVSRYYDFRTYLKKKMAKLFTVIERGFIILSISLKFYSKPRLISFW